jgi:hypothetical protein
MKRISKADREGLIKLDHYLSVGAIDDIKIRQASNSLRVFASGSSYHAGRFDIELRSGEVKGSMLAVLGHMIDEHEGRAAQNV